MDGSYAKLPAAKSDFSIGTSTNCRCCVVRLCRLCTLQSPECPDSSRPHSRCSSQGRGGGPRAFDDSTPELDRAPSACQLSRSNFSGGPSRFWKSGRLAARRGESQGPGTFRGPGPFFFPPLLSSPWQLGHWTRRCRHKAVLRCSMEVWPMRTCWWAFFPRQSQSIPTNDKQGLDAANCDR